MRQDKSRSAVPWLRKRAARLRRRSGKPALLLGLVSASLLLVAARLPAQEASTPRPLLWRVGASSHLLGTIHLGEARVVDLSPVVQSALDSCDVFYAEVPLDPASLLEAMQYILLPDSLLLQGLLPTRLYERSARYLAAHGLDIEAFARMRVWLLATALPLLDNLGGQPLDQRLYERCQKQGKRVAGLETVAEQMGILNSLEPADEVHLLEWTLDLLEESERNGDDYVEKLIQLYLAGDVEALLAFLYELDGADDPVVVGFLDRLLWQRNRVMADRIAATLAREPETAFFFAVGAGHLGGTGGILALLEAHGIAVERVAPLPETVRR